MRGYFVRRISLLQGLSLVVLGFGLGCGSFFLGFVCLLLAVFLDALNGFLQREKHS